MTKEDDRLRHKAEELLQEIRIVLPGTEALLGFQFATFFTSVFQGLDQQYKYIHFITLIFTMVSTILLIAPVAFQQIGEKGDITKRFITFARRMLNAAMLFLLLALAGDAFIAAKAIDIHSTIATIIGALIFLCGTAIWYVYVLIRGSNPGLK